MIIVIVVEVSFPVSLSLPPFAFLDGIDVRVVLFSLYFLLGASVDMTSNTHVSQ